MDERIVHVIWILVVVAILGYLFRYTLYFTMEWGHRFLQLLTPRSNFVFDY